MSNPLPPAPPAYDPYYPADLFVVRHPRPRYWLHALLLAATVFTTMLVGARLQDNFQRNVPAFSLQQDTLPLFPLQWIAHDPARILLGVPFSLTLLLILLAHEMGHYLMAMRYRVNATLPYFIPAPTLIGTLGAFIRIRSPIRSRAELFDIGIAGPIAGFAVALPILIAALALSRPVAENMGTADIVLGYPLIFYWAHHLLWTLGITAGRIPLQQLHLHPTAVAAWVGMFATSLNLLPGGQLDGGHIIYSVAPRLHRWISTLTVVALFLLGVSGILQVMELWPAAWQAWAGWNGWILWAVVVLLMGRRHPAVPAWPGLDRERKWLALVALFLLVVTFMPVPLYEVALH
jgi:membrane-associated protease RseP (regulator of RpoE activity)